uniref:Amino acid permease/ SLC12A domain-containing protein n=1 Tax=Plectus sambesii TaxID=2011161 RepID=A0A914UKC0_9BILA
MVGRPGDTPMGKDNDAYLESQDDEIKRQISDSSSFDGGVPFQQQNDESKMIKFGWIQGVFVRCMLNILGVMLFLRISWVGGQAGLWYGSAIILLSSLVTSLTALSMCAICTNGVVKGGGTYFMISRSLGPEFGGSIGVIFSFANAVGAAMHIVGLAESVTHLMKDSDTAIIDNGTNDVRVIGLAVCCLLMCVVMIGTSFESKIQVLLLFILIASLANFVIGTFLPLKEIQIARGITGYDCK